MSMNRRTAKPNLQDTTKVGAQILGADAAEIAVTKGIPHAGWIYTRQIGTARRVFEVLICMKNPPSDAADGNADDAILPDSLYFGNLSDELDLLGDQEGTDPVWVMSYPGFVDTSDFTVDGFWTVDVDGGLRATYDNLPQRAVKALPATLDYTRPFHFGALFEYGAVTAHRCAVRLESTSQPSFHGISMSADSGDVRIETGTHAFFFLGANLTAGDKFWLGVSMVNGKTTVWMHPVPDGVFGNPVDYLSTVDKAYYVTVDSTYAGGSNGTGPGFAAIDQLAIATSTDTTRVLAVFARQGDFLSGPSNRIEPPLDLNRTVNGDDTAMLFMPKFTPATDNVDLVLMFHGANSSELSAVIPDGNADNGAAMGLLRQNGYAVAVMRGTNDGNYGGANASNFGATYPLQHWWKAYLNRLLAKHNFRNVYLVGNSMGLVNALNFYRNWPNPKIKGIVGISGLSDLSYAYSSEGFKTLIDAAYGSSTVGAIASFDPKLSPSSFTGIPISLWHGNADTTLDYTKHLTAFAAAVNSAGGSVATHVVAGANHLVAACYDGAAILAFLQAHQ